MTPYREKGRRFYATKVPRENGTWSKEPTGTTDRLTAKRMEQMVAALGATGIQAWDLLGAVTARPRRWTLPELYRRWVAVPATKHDRDGRVIPPTPHERAEVIRGELREANLVPLIDTWHAVLTGASRTISTDTADHYRSAVRGYVLSVLKQERWRDLGDDATVGPSAFTEQQLRVYLEEMDDAEPATMRKRGQGLRDFTRWLVRRGVLVADPMANVALPAQGKPLCHYLDTHEAQLLADAQPAPYRHLSALLAGTGIEVSVALGLRRRDVDKKTKEIRAAGTKTYTRDRIVRVAEWAWPYVLELIDGKHADAKLLAEIPDRWCAQDAHIAAVEALVARGHSVFVQELNGKPKRYTMRDQRHTWAVRAARSGWPVEAIGRQLGHVDGVLALRVYGRFVPTTAERERWEQLAAARDQDLAVQRKQAATEGTNRP